VEEMKKRDAIIGGEGNGGVIYPELHYGRDALVGIALFLSHLAKCKIKCSALRKFYPQYVIAKKKLALDPSVEFSQITKVVKDHFKDHLTRIYAEGRTSREADDLADTVIGIVKRS